jgi:predicted HTH domain antitoxin
VAVGSPYPSITACTLFISQVEYLVRCEMSIQIEIPTDVAQAIRLPLEEQKEQLLLELAVALYARGILSFGKARELVGLSKYEFGILLGKRDVPRHYEADDLQDDLTYAHR